MRVFNHINVECIMIRVTRTKKSYDSRIFNFNFQAHTHNTVSLNLSLISLLKQRLSKSLSVGLVSWQYSYLNPSVWFSFAKDHYLRKVTSVISYNHIVRTKPTGENMNKLGLSSSALLASTVYSTGLVFSL
jgi:hypothetical protein